MCVQLEAEMMSLKGTSIHYTVGEKESLMRME